MIRHLTLANFKAFSATQVVPLRPLTLIFGPNSGGKSSVLHSLKWAKHAVKSKSLAFGSSGKSDDTPDFGGFLGAVFGKDRKRKICFGVQLPSKHAPDYRVSFEMGLWTRERKEQALQKPEPPEEVKNWLAAKDEFSAAEAEASRQVLYAPYVLDEKGNPLSDVEDSFVRKELFGEGISGLEALEDSIRQKWEPRLTALWQKWQNENAKSGIKDKLERHFARLENYQNWLDQEDLDPVIFSFEIAIGEKLLLRAERTSFEGHAQLTKVSKALSAIWQYINEDLDSEPWESNGWMDAPWEVTHPSQVLELEDLWDDEVWSGEELAEHIGIEFQGLTPSLINRSVFSGRGDQGIEAQGVLECLEKFIRDCRHRLEGTIAKLNYLGPLRDLPPRSLLMFGKDESLASVADAWLRLRDDPALRDEVNRWIGTGHLDLGYRYESQVYGELASILESMAQEDRSIANEASFNLSEKSYTTGFKSEIKTLGSSPPDFSDASEQAVDFWASKLPRKLRDLALRDLKNNVVVTTRDVGMGISQLIPVVVHALAERQTMIAVEQPELHLHPALQAKLGDLFIESAMGPNQNQFVLETHSEHLILRVLRRIRESCGDDPPQDRPAIRPEDVCVLYIQPGENGSQIIELPVTEDGDFARPWPNGFFDERSDELF